MSGAFEKTISSDRVSLSTRQFLIRCLRSFLAAEGKPQLKAPIEDVDWDFLLQLAAFHRVAPLLDRVLRNGCPQAAPALCLLT